VNTRRREFLRLCGWLLLGLCFGLLLGLPGWWLKTSNFPEEMRAYRECLKDNPERVEACDEQHARAAA
jgi:hypothetical protein